MSNVTFWTDKDGVEQALIDNGDGSFVGMTKAIYEATLAANSAPQG